MIKLDSFVIRGGRRLKGTVRVSGSKNAALPCLFATLLSDEASVIENVPDLKDIRTAVALLGQLGRRASFDGKRLTVAAGGRLKPEASYDLVRRMRASVVVLGPLLARLKRARVSLPGGCAIGARPVNYHLSAFEQMGAELKVTAGYIEARVKNWKPGRVRLPFPSVGATENVLMAAVLAPGRTVLENAAREPEIADLADCLRSMGAEISGDGTSRVVIQGKAQLGGARHRVVADRIEAGTFLVAAAVTKGRVTLKGAPPAAHTGALVKVLRKAGLKVEDGPEGLTAAWTRPLKPVSLKTEVFPGFPTDMQAQWMALMAVTKGRCRITEAIFENRFLHAQEMVRMGARIDVSGSTASVEGVSGLSGCPLMVSDLRAGAALVLAGLAARGVTKVLRVYHLDRGYEAMEKKLRALGADIRRVPQ
jgi:UDP-N-acetylglucosamine 1-carboxyvinyltransferase